MSFVNVAFDVEVENRRMCSWASHNSFETTRLSRANNSECFPYGPDICSDGTTRSRLLLCLTTTSPEHSEQYVGFCCGG